MPLQPFPVNLDFGIVVGRFGFTGIENDTFDPAVGLTVTFTPTAGAVKITTALPDPLILALRPKVCWVDDGGYLRNPDGTVSFAGVPLVATNDPDTNPSGWTYIVSFSLDGGAAPFQDFPMTLMAGQTVDLADVMPAQNSPGVGVPAVIEAVANAVAAKNEAQAIRDGLQLEVDDAFNGLDTRITALESNPSGVSSGFVTAAVAEEAQTRSEADSLLQFGINQAVDGATFANEQINALHSQLNVMLALNL